MALPFTFIFLLLRALSASCFKLYAPFETPLINKKRILAKTRTSYYNNVLNRNRNLISSKAYDEESFKLLSTAISTDQIISNDAMDDDDKWEMMFRKLIIFKQCEGHFQVPHNTENFKDIDDRVLSLGKWLMKQRNDEKRDNIDLYRKQRLEKLGIIWNLKVQRWEDAYRLLVEFKEREGHCIVPSSHVEKGKKLGLWVTNQKLLQKAGKLLYSREERLKKIGFIFDYSMDSWENMYQLLINYKEREGHCLVPQQYQEDGKYLGVWLTAQRMLKKDGKLEKNREKRLEKLDALYDNIREENWEQMFQLLLKYRDREGHCRVPRFHKESGKNLGAWLATLEQRKKDRKLDAKIERRLLDVGLVLRAKSRKTKWDEMYDLLLQFKEREGHCNVPQMHKENEKNLGTWIVEQRLLNKNGKLERLHHEKLEEIGFVFRKSREDRWETMFQLLLQFKEREGHCRVSINHKENGKTLGSWLSKQTINKRNGKLDNAQEKRLLELGFEFKTTQAQRWERMLELLLQFKEREGHLKVPINHKEKNENLGCWLNNQKVRLKKKGKSNADRRKRLLEVGYVI